MNSSVAPTNITTFSVNKGYQSDKNPNAVALNNESIGYNSLYNNQQ